MLDRCGHQCEQMTPFGRCQFIAVHADHILNNDDDAMENLQGLCIHHHNVKTAKEAAEGRRARAARGRMEPEMHPGLRPATPKVQGG